MPKRIKVCKWVTLKSAKGKKHLDKLYTKSGKKGFYKLPGIRKHYIHDRVLRLKAKTSKKERNKILARLRRMHSSKTGKGGSTKSLAKKLGAYVKKHGSSYYGISTKVPRRKHK